MIYRFGLKGPLDFGTFLLARSKPKDCFKKWKSISVLSSTTFSKNKKGKHNKETYNLFFSINNSDPTKH